MTYITNTTQNELIECCKEQILSHIISKVKSSRFYSIMFDETTDLANKFQLTLVLRYVSDGNIYEQFVEFTDVTSKLNASDDTDDPENDVEDYTEIFVVEEKVKLTGAKVGEVVLKIL